MDREKKAGPKKPITIGYHKSFNTQDTTSPLHGFGSKSSWSTFEYNLSEKDRVVFNIMNTVGMTADQMDELRESYKEDCAANGEEFNEDRFQQFNSLFDHQFTCRVRVGDDERSWFTQMDETNGPTTKEQAKEFLRKGLEFFKGTEDTAVILHQIEESDIDPDEDEEDIEYGYVIEITLAKVYPGTVSFGFKVESDDPDGHDTDIDMVLILEEKTLRQMFLDAMYRYDPTYED